MDQVVSPDTPYRTRELLAHAANWVEDIGLRSACEFGRRSLTSPDFLQRQHFAFQWNGYEAFIPLEIQERPLSADSDLCKLSRLMRSGDVSCCGSACGICRSPQVHLPLTADREKCGRCCRSPLGHKCPLLIKRLEVAHALSMQIVLGRLQPGIVRTIQPSNLSNNSVQTVSYSTWNDIIYNSIDLRCCFPWRRIHLT